MVKELDTQTINAILKNSNTAILLMNRKGIITYVSPSIKNLHFETDSILNSSFLDLINKEDKKEILKKIESIYSLPNKTQTITFQSTDKKKNRLLEATITNLLNDTEINRILIHLRDISNHPKIAKLEYEIKQREKIERQLIENEKRYQLIIDHANEGICVVQDGIFKVVNPKICEMLEYDEKDILNKPIFSFIHKDDRDLVSKRYKDRLKRKKVPSKYIFRIIDAHGHIHWVQIHAALFLWDKKPATVNFISEVSEQIYTKKKYEKLFNIAPFLTLEIDAVDYTILYVNSSFCKSVGIPAEKIIGKKAQEILPIDIFKERYQIAQEAIKKNIIIRSVDQRNDKYFYNIVIPLKAPGDKRRLFIFAQDITDLRLFERKYQRLIDSSPDAIAEVDGVTQKIVTVNPAMAKNFNRSKDLMVGLDWKELLPKELLKNRVEFGLKTIKQNKIHIFEDQRNGRYYKNIFVPIKLSDNKINLQIIARDITKTRKTEEKLKENEKKFRTITTSAQDAIVIINELGNIIFWNTSAERIFGYKESEIIGKNVHQLLMSPYYDFPLVKKGFLNFSKSGEGPAIGKTQELKAKQKNGEEFPVELSLSSVKIQNKWHAVGIVRDITMRKKMERELRESKENLEERVKERTHNLELAMNELKESEQRYRSLIQTAPVAIAICDLEGNILDMNEVSKQMIGYHPEEFVFSRYYSNVQERTKLLVKLKKQGSIRNWEFEFVNKNGERFFGLLNIERITYKGKEGYLAIQQDITPLKQTQEELHEVYDYLKNVINSTTEFIFTMDDEKNITMWNKSAELKTGISSSKIIGKNVTDLRFIKNPQALIDHIKNISKGYNPGKTELIIKNKQGSNLFFRISISIIESAEKDSSGYVVVGQDITNAEQLKEKIQLGLSYLQYKTSTVTHESLIIDLNSQGRPFLLVTRGSTVSLHQKTKHMDLDITYLDDTRSDDTHISSCDELLANISHYVSTHEKAVVLIDRLDFLIMKFSFETVLQMIYRLTSLIDSYQAVLIIQINTDMYTTKQLNLLKEELAVFQRAEVEDVTLDESLYQILCFTYKQNQGNIVVSYNKVGDQFHISKVTTGKRILELERKGLVSIQVKGRMKSILATKKAEDLIQKRSRS